MRKTILILLALTIVTGVGYGQVPVKRKRTVKTEQTQSLEAKRQREAEAKRQREAEAKRQREAEAKRQQDAEERRKLELESTHKGFINGHEYVDLGLPSGLKWATCNIGANSSYQYGDYYAWGEIVTIDSESGQCSNDRKDETKLREERVINYSGNLCPNYDAARYNWGASWRMPTQREIVELKEYCKWTLTTQQNEVGYLVTGPNGLSIFLPKCGVIISHRLDKRFKGIQYWSATVDNHWMFANILTNSDSDVLQHTFRSHGLPIRAVSE